MATRFEITVDVPGQFAFALRAEGAVLLQGLPGDSKIMAQNEIQHLRRALTNPDQIVVHSEGRDHFVVVKDTDGSVLARSMHLPTRALLDELVEKAKQAATSAPMIDLAKRAHAS